MKSSQGRRVEFIAKTLTDLGKAILVVGLASYFFEKFSPLWRVVFTISSVVLIVIGILLYPAEGGEG